MEFAIVRVTPLVQNCSLLWCERTRKAVSVDPGGDTERITRVAADNQIEIEQIVLTHLHIDHVGAAGELAAACGAPIIGPHRDDEFLLPTLPQQSEMFGVDLPRTFAPEKWLEAGDEIVFGDVVARTLHCPGHTPGHVAFWLAERRLAVVGDVLFQGSVGRTDFPGGSHGQLLRSIHDNLFPLGDDVEFIAGHGPASTIGIERQTNPFLSATG